MRAQDFAVLELEAVSHFSYEPLLIPGLLQTEEYARTLFEHHCPSMNAEAVEQNIEARLSRQKLLTKSPKVELSFVIGEAALCDAVGGRRVMGKQLRHLLSCGETHNVELQVMRSVTGYHPGLSGPFVLLETREYRQYGYVESQEVGSVVSDPAQVSTFRLRYGKLRSQALNVAESVAFIEQLAEDT